MPTTAKAATAPEINSLFILASSSDVESAENAGRCRMFPRLPSLSLRPCRHPRARAVTCAQFFGGPRLLAAPAFEHVEHAPLGRARRAFAKFGLLAASRAGRRARLAIGSRRPA